MLIRHWGYALKDRRLVVGYVIYKGGDYYIYREDEGYIPIYREPITPVFTDLRDCGLLLRESGHPLGCLELGKGIIRQMNKRGVEYLEDLAGWTNKDYNQIRGIGPVTKKKIKEALEQFGIEFNGTIAKM